MTITQLEKTAIASSNSQELNTLPRLTTKYGKKQLVAQWLVDENSKLYCQWVTKD